LKEKNRFYQTININAAFAKNQLNSKTMKTIITSPPDIFLLPTCTGTELITISNIIRIEAVSNYSKLFFANASAATGGKKTLVVAKVLKWFDELLSDKGFIRIHRSHLINLSCINSYNNNNQHTIILQNQEHIDISRRRRISIMKRLARPTAA
jgi:two-component system, LytTR family, response regulator